MKKTIVISFKNLIKKTMVLLMILTIILLTFSMKIPHLICEKMTEDLLLQQQKSFPQTILEIFSLQSKNTVYAAMPVENHPVTQKPVTTIPAPTPSASPSSEHPSLPQSDLSANSSAQNIAIKNHTQKTFDKAELLQKPLLWQNDKNGYKVLIVHTHTTESYYPNDRSDNTDENMIRVGKEFKQVLEDNGIATLHITTVHDVPYTTSYKKSLESVTQALAEHPSIQVVIDLHRDAIYGANGEKLRPVTTINGEEAAQVMLVCGTDEGGLPHPDWKENLSFAAKIQNSMQQTYPNLARPLDLRKERFNTHTTKNSVIFEIGSNGNSIEEAIRGARLAAQSVADVLNTSR